MRFWDCVIYEIAEKEVCHEHSSCIKNGDLFSGSVDVM